MSNDPAGRGGGFYPPRQNPHYPPQQGYYPQQQQQGYYPQQQQGYYPQQQQGYYPQQQQQQWAAPGGMQQGYPGYSGGFQPASQPYYPGQGYQPQQGYVPGGNQGYGKPSVGVGLQANSQSYTPSTNVPQPRQQQQQQQQPKQTAAQPPRSTPAKQPTPKQPEQTAADAAKLSLGGGNAQPVMPKKTKGGTLSLGKMKEDEREKEKKAEEAAVKAKAEAETEKRGSAPASTSAVASSTAAGKLSKQEMREQVMSELAKQRQQNKKEYTRDPRPHYNVVFCGHVDAGKSTISGRILADRGLIDQREMEKLKREAQVQHREGWEFAYVMDVSEDERVKGITRETGAAYVETDKRRITVLDAPGHKAFVPSMIGGAAQADVCVLVISSRTGEFETGLERGGQTSEHITLVRTCGVRQMICVINKMDESKWSSARYDEILQKLKPVLKKNGYEEKKNLTFLPVAGLTGENLTKPLGKEVCSWYSGPILMDILNEVTLPESKSEDKALCIPIVSCTKDEGRLHIVGKLEAGTVVVGEKLQILPGKAEAIVESISVETTELEKAFPGENVQLRLRGIEESDIHPGYVATSIPTTLVASEFIKTRIIILETKSLISEGSKMMLHVHTAQVEASIHKILGKRDKQTGNMIKNPTHALPGDEIVARVELEQPLVVTATTEIDKMGRFMLRDDGKTVAIGLVVDLYESTKDSLAKAAKA